MTNRTTHLEVLNSLIPFPLGRQIQPQKLSESPLLQNGVLTPGWHRLVRLGRVGAILEAYVLRRYFQRNQRAGGFYSNGMLYKKARVREITP